MDFHKNKKKSGLKCLNSKKNKPPKSHVQTAQSIPSTVILSTQQSSIPRSKTFPKRSLKNTQIMTRLINLPFSKLRSAQKMNSMSKKTAFSIRAKINSLKASRKSTTKMNTTKTIRFNPCQEKKENSNSSPKPQ